MSAHAHDPPRPAIYDPGGFRDEALLGDGTPRPAYAEVLPALAAAEGPALAGAVAGEVRRLGVSFGDWRFVVDPIPRIFEAGEWARLARGIAQRVRALNAFLADVYGAREIVACGRMPARTVEAAPGWEPDMAGVAVPAGHVQVAGLDVVRGPDGVLRVLEDNLRTPSGIAYALAARAAVDPHLPIDPPPARARLEVALDALAGALRRADPSGGGDPRVVLLSDGASNSAWWEHARLAERLGLQVVTPAELRRRARRLQASLPGGRGWANVDVVYRRTDEDRLRDERGRPTWLADLLLEPCRAGTLAMVNAFGTGVADDKLVHAYVEDMVRFYLGEQPLLPSVRTFDLALPEMREQALARLDEMVVKPRAGYGGDGVVVCPHATREDRARIARAIRERRDDLVAQETVWLSRHPTVCDGRIAPRHVDLRAFAVSADDDVTVLSGGLTRVALSRGALVVNSSQHGGGKDTWVLS